MAQQGDAVAKRYAEAVFGLAREGGTEDAWRADLGSLAELVSDPAVAAYLANAKISDANKERLVRTGLQDVTPAAMNLALLLLQRDRFSYAPEIATIYDRLLDEARGIAIAEVTTAVPLSEDARQLVAERLRQVTDSREVRLQTRVDPALIGGMVVRIGDRLIDGSTRTKLVQLKRSLAGAAR